VPSRLRSFPRIGLGKSPENTRETSGKAAFPRAFCLPVVRLVRSRSARLSGSASAESIRGVPTPTYSDQGILSRRCGIGLLNGIRLPADCAALPGSASRTSPRSLPSALVRLAPRMTSLQRGKQSRVPTRLLGLWGRVGEAYRPSPTNFMADGILKLGLPSGSLMEATISLFQKAGFSITGASRSYRPVVDDPEIRINLLRAQEMSRYVEGSSSTAASPGVTGSRKTARRSRSWHSSPTARRPPIPPAGSSPSPRIPPTSRSRISRASALPPRPWA